MGAKPASHCLFSLLSISNGCGEYRNYFCQSSSNSVCSRMRTTLVNFLCLLVYCFIHTLHPNADHFPDAYLRFFLLLFLCLVPGLYPFFLGLRSLIFFWGGGHPSFSTVSSSSFSTAYSMFHMDNSQIYPCTHLNSAFSQFSSSGCILYGSDW